MKCVCVFLRARGFNSTRAAPRLRAGVVELLMRHLFFAPVLLALAAAPVFAQTTARPTPPASGIAATIAQAERNQDPASLLFAYGQAVVDPNLAPLAIGGLLSSFYILRNQAQTPDQANQAINEVSLRFQVLQTAQNQVLIQQNQQILQQNAQIIALLQRGQGGR